MLLFVKAKKGTLMEKNRISLLPILVFSLGLLFLWNCSKVVSKEEFSGFEITIPFDTIDVSQYDSVKVIVKSTGKGEKILGEHSIDLPKPFKKKDTTITLEEEPDIELTVVFLTFYKDGKASAEYKVTFPEKGEYVITRLGIWVLNDLLDVSLSVGDTLVLTYKVGGDVKEYKWYKDDQLLKGESSSKLNKVISSLSDKGTYRVEAISENGKSLFSESKVEVSEASIGGVDSYRLSAINTAIEKEGSPLDLSVLPDTGYQIDSVKVNGELDSAGEKSGKVVIDSVTKETKVKACFSPLVYTISTEINSGGGLTLILSV